MPALPSSSFSNLFVPSRLQLPYLLSIFAYYLKLVELPWISSLPTIHG